MSSKFVGYGVKAFNYIATGKPEMPVGGQNAMLPEKKRNSKAY